MNIYQKLSDRYPIEIQQKYRLKFVEGNQLLVAFDGKFQTSIQHIWDMLVYHKLDILEVLHHFFERNPSINYEISTYVHLLKEPEVVQFDIRKDGDITNLETLYFWYPFNELL